MRTDTNRRASAEVASKPLHSLENITTTSVRSSRRASIEKRNAAAQQLVNSSCANSIRSMSAASSNGDCTGAMQISNEPFTQFYEIETVIGRGLFGSVKRCRCLRTGQLYAAKFLRKQYKGKDHRTHLMKEVSMLQRVLNHPNIVHIVELYETNHELIIVTEYASGGELHSYIDDEEGLSEDKSIKVMKQLLNALIFLHDENIVHLDLKPQNILLTGDPHDVNIKLCDFGSALLLCEDREARQIAGTENYVPPEVLSYDPIHTASDMWTVGVVAYITLTGHFPFAGDSKQETFLNISQLNLDFPDNLFEGISQEAQDFITELCVLNPSDRLTARECLEHPWLKSSGPSCTVAPSIPAAVAVSTPSSVTSSPASTPRCPATSVGSPPGVRRTLSPPSPGTTLEEPTKKCRCDTPSPDNMKTDSSVLNGSVAHNNSINGNLILSKDSIVMADVDNSSSIIATNEGVARDSTTVSSPKVSSPRVSSPRVVTSSICVNLNGSVNNENAAPVLEDNVNNNNITTSNGSIGSTSSKDSRSSTQSTCENSRVSKIIKNYEQQMVC